MISWLLLLSGVLFAPLFLVLVLFQQARRPSYSPVRQPISALAHGPEGWVQTTNFLISGLLATACAIGIWMTADNLRLISILTGAFGLCLAATGAFSTDLTGYEITAGRAATRPLSGLLHDLFAVAGCLALYAACFLAGRILDVAGEPNLAIYSYLSAVFGVLALVSSGAGFAGLHRFGGAAQRVAVAIGWLWLSLAALYLLLG